MLAILGDLFSIPLSIAALRLVTEVYRRQKTLVEGVTSRRPICLSGEENDVSGTATTTQRGAGRRPNRRAARILAGCFVARRSKTIRPRQRRPNWRLSGRVIAGEMVGHKKNPGLLSRRGPCGALNHPKLCSGFLPPRVAHQARIRISAAIRASDLVH